MAAHRHKQSALSPIEAARRYIAVIPSAVSGSNGHSQTFKVASALVWGFALDPDDALPLFEEWNENCEPSWSESELRHKLDDALAKPKKGKDRGYLLTASEFKPKERQQTTDRRPQKKTTDCEPPTAEKEGQQAVESKPAGGVGRKRGKKISDWLKLTDDDERDAALSLWLSAKPGISEEALKQIGYGSGTHRYSQHSPVVIAFGVFSPDAPPTVCGCATYRADGKRFEMGGNIEPVKVKLVKGSSAGIVGRYAAEGLAAGKHKKIIKTAGITDHLAIQSELLRLELCDEFLSFTNSSGETENPDKYSPILSKALAAAEYFVIADNDDTGRKGAEKWARHGLQCGAMVRIVILPDNVNGLPVKDVRDYFVAGKTFADLRELMDGSPALSTDDLLAPSNESDTDTPEFKEQYCTDILKELDLHIFGIRRDNTVIGYSGITRRVFSIPRIGVYGLDDLVLDGGTIIDNKVIPGESANGPAGTYPFAHVKRAISREASKRTIASQHQCGTGIWRDSETGHIVIVGGNGQAAVWTGTTLEKLTMPFYGGLQLDFNTSTECFYDFDTLKAELESFDLKDAEKQFESLLDIVSQWNWDDKNPNTIILVTGLICATLIQTVFNWRPSVYITGQAESGKSEFLKLLGFFFNQTDAIQAKPTEAAVRQFIGTSAKPIIIDELEAGKYRQPLMELLRTSGNGSKISRGNRNGHFTTSYGLRHIPWLASIECNLNNKADSSRFLDFELTPPKKSADSNGPRKQLLIPETELKNIGQSIMIALIVNANKIRDRISELRGLAIDGHGIRVVESYAVPFAVAELLFSSMESANAEHFIRQTLTSKNASNGVEALTDHDQLISDILDTVIHVNGLGDYTVEQVLKNRTLTEYTEALERIGIITEYLENFYHKGKLFVITSRLEQNLTNRIKRWEGANIGQILKRHPDAVYQQKKIKGEGNHPKRGYWIPIDVFEQKEATVGIAETQTDF